MATKKQDEFLGGGPKFNPVGAPVAPSAPHDSRDGDTGPIQVRVPGRDTWRIVVIVALILVMAFGVYFMENNGLGGLGTREGHGGHEVVKPSVDPDHPNQ